MFNLFNLLLLLLLMFIGLNVGGNGGRGGDVILECSTAIWDFSGLQNHVVCYPPYLSLFSSFNHIGRLRTL